MKTFQICGYTKSGKTTVLTSLIRHFTQMNQQVASIKDIHNQDFQMDTEGKNTYLHKQAGADPVIARGLHETDFLYGGQMDFLAIVSRISADWLMVEGYHDFPLPKIVCGKSEKEVDQFLDRRTFAIAGVLGDTKTIYRYLPVFNVSNTEDVFKLSELVQQKVFPLLPYVADPCCQQCGLTCSKMVEAIIQGEKSFGDCMIHKSSIRLQVGENDIPMVPFVQKMLRNGIMGMVSELKGWEKGKRIQIVIEG